MELRLCREERGQTWGSDRGASYTLFSSPCRGTRGQFAGHMNGVLERTMNHQPRESHTRPDHFSCATWYVVEHLRQALVGIGIDAWISSNHEPPKDAMHDSCLFLGE